jgi:hypothetical protein
VVAVLLFYILQKTYRNKTYAFYQDTSPCAAQVAIFDCIIGYVRSLTEETCSTKLPNMALIGVMVCRLYSITPTKNNVYVISVNFSQI